MNLDIPRLLTDINSLQCRIRAVKGPLRQRWTEPMADAQADLLDLAAEVTTLYTLLAWSRGRLHRTQPPRHLRDACRDLGETLEWDAKEHNRDVAERVAERYRVPPAEPTSMPVEHAAPLSSIAS